MPLRSKHYSRPCRFSLGLYPPAFLSRHAETLGKAPGSTGYYLILLCILRAPDFMLRAKKFGSSFSK